MCVYLQEAVFDGRVEHLLLEVVHTTQHVDYVRANAKYNCRKADKITIIMYTLRINQHSNNALVDKTITHHEKYMHIIIIHVHVHACTTM